MSLDTQLRTLLDERLDAVVPPPGDLAAVRRAGRRLQRRRRALTTGAGALVTVAVAGVVLRLGTSQGPGPEHAYDPLGPMDFSQGLRAYGDPAGELHLGGRTIAAADLPFLDTDAVATPYGVVFYRGGDLLLVQEDGTTTTLDQGDATPDDFHPTAKADAAAPLVAYAVVGDEGGTLKVLDLARREIVASRPLGCRGSCDGLVIEGIDSGAVFVRTDDGTAIWRYDDGDAMASFAGPDTRVADVRTGVVLYDGPRPDGEAANDWTLVPGAIDGQLTFDGRYVLAWSSRLQPTDPAAPALMLVKGPVKGLGFWTIDTDGSVLVAAPGRKDADYTVYDCVVPSGQCEELGPLTPRGGDPVFIGNDM